eukprot:gene7381-9066_t
MSHHHHHHEHVHHCPKSTGVAYLLWFFFGIFGAHRFYLHRHLSGFIYLFTLGVFGIGWFVDLFLIPSLVRHYNNHYFSDPTIIVAPAPIVYQTTASPYQSYPYQPQPYYSQPPNMSALSQQQQQPVYPYQPQPNNPPYNPPVYQP